MSAPFSAILAFLVENRVLVEGARREVVVDGGDGEAVSGEVEGRGRRAHRLLRFSIRRMDQPRQRGRTKILMEPKNSANTMTLDQMNGAPAHLHPRTAECRAAAQSGGLSCLNIQHSMKSPFSESPSKPSAPASASVSPSTKSSRPFAITSSAAWVASKPSPRNTTSILRSH